MTTIVRRGAEAVELDEQLVERLLALLVRVGAAARLAQRVELVDEDHALAEPARLGEQVAHAPRAHADVLLDEVRAGGVVEGHAGLGRDRAGEHRLAGARRAVEQDAARHSCAQRAEAFRVAQELDRLGQLELGFFAAGDIRQMDERRSSRPAAARSRPRR